VPTDANSIGMMMQDRASEVSNQDKGDFGGANSSGRSNPTVIIATM